MICRNVQQVERDKASSLPLQFYIRPFLISPSAWRRSGHNVSLLSTLTLVALLGTPLTPFLARAQVTGTPQQAEQTEKTDKRDKQEANQEANQRETEKQAEKPDGNGDTKQDKGKPNPQKRVGPGGLEDVPQLEIEAVLPVSVQFSWWNTSLMNSRVTVAGKQTSCIFDTGLSANTLSPDLVTLLKLDTSPSMLTVHSLNDTRTVPTVALNGLKFNLLSLDLPRVGILDSSEVYTGQPQQGAPLLWLGLPFFAAFQVTLDYENSTIILERPNAKPPHVNDAVVLPLDIRNGRIQTRVSVPEVGSFMAIIDTGTLGTLIPNSIAQKLKLIPRRSFTISRPNGTTAHASLVFVPQLQLGRLVQDQVPALYFEKPEAPKVAPKPSKSPGPAPTTPPGTPNNTPSGTAPTSPAASSSTNPGTPSAGGSPIPGASTSTPQVPAGAGNVTAKPAQNVPVPPADNKPVEIPDKTLDYNMAVLGNDFLRHYKVILNLQQHKLILIPPPPKPGEEGFTPKPPDKKTPPTAQPRNGSRPRQF